MKHSFFLSTSWLLFLASLSASSPNVLLLCIDDLRPELGCYGVEPIHSPNIDALAAESRLYDRHYVQAPTCGASRYALLTGTYGPSGNGALFSRAKKIAKEPSSVTPSLPAWFRQNGYQTVSLGKVSHHPGGFGGSDWDDPERLEMPLSWDRSLMPSGAWKHPRGAMHGLANGEVRKKAKDMAIYQSFDGPDTAYPDGLITEASLTELETLATDERPFFLAVGLIRPHLPFGAPAKYMEPYREASLPPVPHPDKPQGTTTWHRSGEFMKYQRWDRDPNTDADFALEVRKHYAACVTYVDEQVGHLLAKLKELGIDDDTVVVLWGDHGWHLGEHAIWGKHSLFEESLRAPLIIRKPSLPDPGAMSDAVVESVDLYPTLCELAGLSTPDGLDGSSLLGTLEDASTLGETAVSYHGSQVTVRTDRYRLIVHKKGYAELYDHTTPEKETRNLAEEKPEVVAELTKILAERVPEKVPR